MKTPEQYFPEVLFIMLYRKVILTFEAVDEILLAILKLIHTRKDLFRFRINSDSDCLYCGEHDSLNTFIDCQFTKPVSAFSASLRVV